MTRKDFELIANTINEQFDAVRLQAYHQAAKESLSLPGGDSKALWFVQGQEDALVNVVQAFSNKLALDNPRFKASLFIAACIEDRDFAALEAAPVLGSTA